MDTLSDPVGGSNGPPDGAVSLLERNALDDFTPDAVVGGESDEGSDGGGLSVVKTTFGGMGRGMFLRKPLSVVTAQEEELPPPGEAPGEEGEDGGGGVGHVKRHMSLFDLTCVGIGGTIGSGIFVLCGRIARDYSGPATCLSWTIAGVVAMLSGFCYAELAGRIPSEGSTYAYAYVAMGELPAVVAAACLTLEYGVSGSAVARSWGDKIVDWLESELGAGSWVEKYLDPGFGVNPMAFLVSAGSLLLLLLGIRESKLSTNIITVTKVCVVIFMIIGGFILTTKENLTPFVPPEYGFAGVMRGATSLFFGYIGFDQACCLAGEAVDGPRDMPRSVLLTLFFVTVVYILAGLALTGMQPYEQISDISGFPEAFRYNGWDWAAQLSAAGEVLTLPVVVLISLIAQPRLQYAMARDGLLPSFFAQVDDTGNLINGIWVAGVAMTLIATFIPFRYLDDLISGGILVAFSTTDCAVVVLRRASPPSDPRLLEKLLIALNAFSLGGGLVLAHGLGDYDDNGKLSGVSIPGVVMATIFVAAAAASTIAISRWCPPALFFGGGIGGASAADGDDSYRYFRTPLVPYVPCLGVFANWYLIAQLEATGLGLLLLYLALAVVFYFAYGARHSIGNSSGWDCVDVDGLGTEPADVRDEGGGVGRYARLPSGESSPSPSHLHIDKGQLTSQQ